MELASRRCGFLFVNLILEFSHRVTWCSSEKHRNYAMFFVWKKEFFQKMSLTQQPLTRPSDAAYCGYNFPRLFGRPPCRLACVLKDQDIAQAGSERRPELFV
jgi:hypothetical protein